MSLLGAVKSFWVATPEQDAYLSEVDEELDAGDEVAVFLYPPVPARRA